MMYRGQCISTYTEEEKEKLPVHPNAIRVVQQLYERPTMKR